MLLEVWGCMSYSYYVKKEWSNLENSTFKRSHGGKKVPNGSRYSPSAKRHSNECFSVSLVIKPVPFLFIRIFLIFLLLGYSMYVTIIVIISALMALPSIPHL